MKYSHTKRRFLARALICFLMIAALSFSLVSCSDSGEDNDELRRLAEELSEALANKDAEAVKILLDPKYFTDADIDGLMDKASAYLGDHSVAEISVATGFSSKLHNGVATRSITYLVDTDGKPYYLEVIQVSGSRLICGFNIVLREEATPTLAERARLALGTNPMQWIVLFFGIVLAVLPVLAIIDCARRRIAKKTLWMILIIFGFISLNLTLFPPFNINFGLGFWLKLSTLMIYSGGTTVLSLSFPVGAFLYFGLRKRYELTDGENRNNGKPEEQKNDNIL